MQNSRKASQSPRPKAVLRWVTQAAAQFDATSCQIQRNFGMEWQSRIALKSRAARRRSTLQNITGFFYPGSMTHIERLSLSFLPP